jgi:Bacterial low temperature requirement A protein (LtrA)
MPRPSSRRGSSLLDDFSNGAGLRYVDRMAGRCLFDGCARSSGHLPLGLGRDHPIIGRDQIPAGAVGWWGTWTLTLIVLGLIAIAVGDELGVVHPGDDATLGFTILTFGGPALFLLAQVIFLREALGHVPRSRPLAVAVLAILAVATAPLTMIVGIAASSAVLVAVAAADTVEEDRPRSVSALAAE